MADLTPLVEALAAARQEAVVSKTAVTTARAAFEAANAALLATDKANQEAEAAADTALRAAVLDAFRATGDVAPAPGCKVVQRTTLTYTEADALAWAKVSGLALKLDVKAFEKIAKATPVPGVTEGQEPSVTVATDLAAVLVPKSA